MSRLLSPLSYGPPGNCRLAIVDCRLDGGARQSEGREFPAFALNPRWVLDLPAPALAAAAFAVAVVPAAAAATATPAAVEATEVAEATTAASPTGAATIAVATATAGTAAEATTAGAATAATAESTAATRAAATEARERARLWLEAVTAVDRAVATGFEGDFRFLAARGAGRVKELPRRPAVTTAERATRFAILLLLQPPAIRTTPGLPRKSLRSMKLLFTRGEHERLAAIAADERLVGVRHPIDLLD